MIHASILSSIHLPQTCTHLHMGMRQNQDTLVDLPTMLADSVFSALPMTLRFHRVSGSVVCMTRNCTITTQISMDPREFT